MNVKDAKRIVVKVGTSTLTYENGKMNLRRIDQLAQVLSDISNSGHQVMLVSSGAIAAGVGRLGLAEKPADTRGKQAVASVGQCELIGLYDRMFSEYGKATAQLLLTKTVLDSSEWKQNAINTINALLEWDIIPIVNENDAISIDEIWAGGNFGDNDTLSAIVAKLVGADLLVILSDIDGLYSSDPRTDPDAKLLPVVERIHEEHLLAAGGAGSKRGTGGMVTKLQAARIATEAGVNMVITNGKEPRVLYQILDGEQVGTLFPAGV